MFLNNYSFKPIFYQDKTCFGLDSGLSLNCLLYEENFSTINRLG